MISQAYNPRSNIFYAEEFCSFEQIHYLTCSFLDFQNILKHSTKDNIFFVFTGLNAAQQTRGVKPVLVWCWASVADCGPALDQLWVNGVMAGSVDKCFAPKQNNKFRLIHSLYQELYMKFLSLLSTGSNSYQPLWLCCWRGDISSFFSRWLLNRSLDCFPIWYVRYLDSIYDLLGFLESH